jgi:deoxyribonuclease V
MRINRRHSWNVSLKQAGSIQTELASGLVLAGRPERMVLVAGADASYSKSSDKIFGAVILMNIDAMDVVEISRARGRVSFPYIPGYLTFREGPVLIKAFERLHTIPDAVIFDGQGFAHRRGMGLASHLGMWLDIPSIGCAKSRLLGEHKEPGKRRGSRTRLLHDGQTIGYVVRTRTGVSPVYISAGHLIGLSAAVDVVMKATAGYRLAEPVRLAHIETNRMRKEVEG